MNNTLENRAAVLKSLASAADVARQAYMTALQANVSGSDLSELYVKEMAAATIWSSADLKALGPDPDITTAQQALDVAISSVRADLTSVKMISDWVTRITNLVNLATKVSEYFVA